MVGVRSHESTPHANPFITSVSTIHVEALTGLYAIRV